MIITVYVDGPTYWKLGSIAESRKVKIADVAASVLRTQTEMMPDSIRMSDTKVDALRLLVGAGWSDHRIGQALSAARTTVASRRNGLGLPAGGGVR